MGHYRNDSCRVCNSKDLKIVLPLEASPLADSFVTKEQLNLEQKLYEMDVYKCSCCGLVQLIDVIEPEDIYIDYLYRTNTSVGLPKHFETAAGKIVKKFSVKKDSLVLDIGSNDGSLLQGYKNFGLKVLGIDPAVEVAKEATERGIETLPIFFNSQKADELITDYGKAKIITCNNLIANIDNLNDFVKGIKKFLDKDGIFISETSYLLGLIDSMVFDTIYHEHLSYFGIKPLEYLFEQNDLMIFDAEVVETKGGSLRFFVTHLSKKKEISANLKELKTIENNRKLYEDNIYLEYESKINKSKETLNNFINNAIKDGKKIVGYGASNTTTTLLFHFELNNKIDYIVDDNEIKIGRYSPNSHIPIYSSEKIYEDNPDYIIVFAWRYADIIINKNQKYLDNNGTFIIPLKEFKEVSKRWNITL